MAMGRTAVLVTRLIIIFMAIVIPKLGQVGDKLSQI